MKKMSVLFSATAMLLATAMPASAATLLYSFAPSTTGVQRFTFNVDSNPVVSSSDDFQSPPTVRNLTVGGIARSGTPSFTFVADAIDGGFESTITGIGSYLGPQLYTGLASAPTLRTGTFSLFGGPGNASGTLTVTAVAAVIPEPDTWAMMAIGFGLAASAMRRRKITTRVSYATSQS